VRIGDDYRRVQANPEQFGGLIARGGEEVATGLQREAQGLKEKGQGQEALGRGTFDLSKTFGKVAANDAFNQINDQAQKILHGDPNKTGPNGAPSRGYLSLDGRAALQNRPIVEQQLDQLVSGARDNMTTLDQQLEFDTISRRFRAQWTAEIGAHADAGAKQWYGDVYQNNVKQGLEGVSSNSGNSFEETEARKHHAADTINGLANLAVLQEGAATLPDGTTPDPNDPLVKAAVAKGEKLVNEAYIRSLAVKFPDKAQKLLDTPEMQKKLGDAYPALAEHLAERAEQVNTGARGVEKIKLKSQPTRSD
jgi:hypothetical protein